MKTSPLTGVSQQLESGNSTPSFSLIKLAQRGNEIYDWLNENAFQKRSSKQLYSMPFLLTNVFNNFDWNELDRFNKERKKSEEDINN